MTIRIIAQEVGSPFTTNLRVYDSVPAEIRVLKPVEADMRADNEQELEQQAQDERDRLKLRGVQMDGHVISSFRDRDPAAFRSCFHSLLGAHLFLG